MTFPPTHPPDPVENERLHLDVGVGDEVHPGGVLLPGAAVLAAGGGAHNNIA